MKILTKYLAVICIVVLAGCYTTEHNLIGTWRSDPSKTLPRLAKIEKLSPNIRRNMKATVGNSELIFGNTNFVVHTFSNGARVPVQYHILSNGLDSVTIEMSVDGAAPMTQTLQFERNGFWILQSAEHGFWEYFKKTE